MSDTAPQATGLAGAAQAFEGILAGKTGNDDPSNTPTEDSEHEPEGEDTPEGDEAQHEPDETPEGEEAEGEGEGEGDAEGEGEPEGDEPEHQQTLTVKIDGKEVEVPLEEAAKGYQRHADYSRKTAALADERRAFDEKTQKFAEHEQSVVQERAQYAHLLRALQERLDELAPQEPDWVALAQQMTPQEYQQQRAVWDAIKEQKAAAKAESDRISAKQADDGKKALQTKLAQGRAKLLEYNSDWKDGKKWDADRQAIFKYGQDVLGFTPQEIANATDPRAIIAVDKARKYDELIANKPRPSANPKSGKRPVKPLQAGSANTPSRVTTDATKAKQRLAQTGRVADAASVFEKML